MTLNDLITRVAQTTHRTDLTALVPAWAQDATERINRRFGVTLVMGAATDPLPAPDLIYLFATMQAAYEYLNNGDNAQAYSTKWELECDRQNVLNPGSVLDNYAAAPPYIMKVT